MKLSLKNVVTVFKPGPGEVPLDMEKTFESIHYAKAYTYGDGKKQDNSEGDGK